MTERVTIDINGAVATVTLARPEKRNALDMAMLEGLVDAGTRLSDEKAVRVVVLSGMGGTFSAGIDTGALPQILNAVEVMGGLLTRSHGQSNIFQAAAMVWRDLPMPVIAAVEGVAFGGGLQIMLGADIRIAAPDAMFSIMEGKWGLIPDMGLTVTAADIRNDILRRLTYTAEVFNAEQARDWGFISEVAEDPINAALTLAQTIANRSPDAVRAAKHLYTEAPALGAAERLLLESRLQAPLPGSPNQLEATTAALGKRAPEFKD